MKDKKLKPENIRKTRREINYIRREIQQDYRNPNATHEQIRAKEKRIMDIRRKFYEDREDRAHERAEKYNPFRAKPHGRISRNPLYASNLGGIRMAPVIRPKRREERVSIFGI